MNVQQGFKIAFTESQVGKYVWQFHYEVDDSCHHHEIPFSKHYVLSDGLWEPPCCIPGYAVDAPFSRLCHSEEALIYKHKHNCSVVS